MIKKYPEITHFFSQNQFDDNDLDELFKRIEHIYNDAQEREIAKMLIRLELLKFELKEKEQVKKNEAPNVTASIPRTTEKIKKSEKQKKVKKNPNEKRDAYVREKLLILRNSTYAEAADILDISFDLLSRIVKKRFLISQSDKVDSDTFLAFREYAQKRLGNLYRRSLLATDKDKKKGSYPKKSGKSSSNTSVYDKMRLYGIRGRIIYIRKST